VEDPREWAAAAVEAACDAIVTCDRAGRIVHVNRAAEELLARPRDALVGGAMTDLIAAPGLAELAPGGPVEARVQRDGQTVVLELTLARTGADRCSAFLRDPGGATRMSALLESAEDLAGMGAWELDLESGEARWTDGMYRIHGLEPQSIPPGLDMLLEHVHPDDRGWLAGVLEDLEAVPPEGVVDEYRALLPDGSVRHVRFLRRLETDRRTGRRRWLGAGQDVTPERLTERELQAHYAVSQALREWESFEEGVVGLLRRMGTALDYPLASLWLWRDRDRALRCRAFWHAPAIDPGEFEAESRTVAFPAGEGKPGVAWARCEPVVTPDIAGDPEFRPRDAALAAGVRSAIHFPAVGPDGPLAVLSLYSRERSVPSPSLVRTLTGIGRDLGRFLARRRAQLGPRPLSDRELEVLNLAAEGCSGPQMAERLFVSPSTIKTHLEHIYEKLGVSDRASAVATALRIGLVT
jgi:DNA-binding CsgD family transcriptional regulator/PAS domain-containing protein